MMASRRPLAFTKIDVESNTSSRDCRYARFAQMTLNLADSPTSRSNSCSKASSPGPGISNVVTKDVQRFDGIPKRQAVLRTCALDKVAEINDDVARASNALQERGASRDPAEQSRCAAARVQEPTCVTGCEEPPRSTAGQHGARPQVGHMRGVSAGRPPDHGKQQRDRDGEPYHKRGGTLKEKASLDARHVRLSPCVNSHLEIDAVSARGTRWGVAQLGSSARHSVPLGVDVELPSTAGTQLRICGAGASPVARRPRMSTDGTGTSPRPAPSGRELSICSAPRS